MKRFLIAALIGLSATSLSPSRTEAARFAIRARSSSRPTPHYLLLKSDPRRNNGPNYFVHPPFKK